MTSTSTATPTYEDRLWAEVDEIGALLHELDPAELDAPSLWAGWRVRDVIGHMAYGHTTPMPKIVVALARYRFDIPKGSFELSKEWASARSPEQIVAEWDRDLVAGRARKGIAK